MFTAATEAATQTPDWLTIGLSLVIGLFGGVTGAWIAARTQRLIAKRAARHEASKALWSFHRVLHDYALEFENDLTHEGPAITNTTKDDIAAARAEAYVYRGYLAPDKVDLVSGLLLPYWDHGMDPMTVSDEVWDRAKKLEAELIRVFGKDAK